MNSDDSKMNFNINPNNLLLNSGNISNQDKGKETSDIKKTDSYKPTGNFVYNQDMLDSIKMKIAKLENN